MKWRVVAVAKFQVISQYVPGGIVDITKPSVRVAEVLTWDLSNYEAGRSVFYLVNLHETDMSQWSVMK
jgi:hypothetical protein